MGDSPTRRLARYAHSISYENLPKAVIEKAKTCILDTLACVLQGSKGNEFRNMSEALQRLDHGEEPVWGTGIRTSRQNALMLLASMAHSTEYDDSHKQSKTHPGAVIIPAALTAGKIGGPLNGKRLIEAVVAGYEISLRVGIALDAGEHRLRGWHNTATCGILGAAIASGKVLSLSEDELISALGSAGTQASGIWAFASDGSMSKSLHAGRAAQGGLLSALLAQSGFTGSKYIFEAEDGGFFKVFAPQLTDEWKETLTANLMDHWAIMHVAYKPYPCCRTTHCAIDAALELQAKYDVSIDEIKKVTIKTYHIAVKQCGFSNPPNSYLAKFSFAFVVALALMRKRPLRFRDFSDEMLMNKELMALHNRISVEWSEELETLFPQKWPCEVLIELTDGRHLRQRVDIAKGDPLNPMKDKELANKVHECATDVLSHDQVERLIAVINNLEDVSDMEVLYDGLT